MTRRAGVERAPADHVVAGAWPTAEVGGVVEAEVAQAFARNLVEAIGEQSFREIGRRAGVDHTTIGAVTAGRRWVDSVTLVRLEVVLGRLWPDEHVRPGQGG